MILYSILILLMIIAFIGINIKLFSTNKYWPFVFLFFYAYTWLLLSNIVLEYGFYIIEEQRYSFWSFATIRLFIYIIFFFIGLYLGVNFQIRKTERKNIQNITYYNNKKKIIIKILIIIIILVLFVLYFNLFNSPIPLFDKNVNRFNYWDKAKFSFLRHLFGNISIPISIILGVLLFYSIKFNLKKLKKYVLILFLFYVVYLFLIGQKFSGQLLAFYFFILPLWSYNLWLYKKVCINYKIKALIFILIITMFIYIYYKYMFTGISSLYGGAFYGILYRIFVLQGHLYWGADNIVFLHNNFSFYNLYNLLFKYHLDGMQMLMYLISPQDLVNYYLKHNVRFTEAFPAILIVINPYIAILFELIFGFFIGIIIKYIFHLLNKNRIISSIISIYLLFNIYIAFVMADFRFILSFKFVVILVILYIDFMLMNFQKRKNSDYFNNNPNI